jgi:hypothetical protein
MPEERGSGKEKTIEMRLAEIEDKLSKMHITEEEMKAYEKVSSLIGSPAAGGSSGLASQILRNRFIIPRQIIRFCYECGGCGPCACDIGGGFTGGGGFGGLGQ